MLDLPYVEDVRAEVDMNVVMTGAGRFIEVQGTAEGMPFSRSELDDLLRLAEGGIKLITEVQTEVVADPPSARPSTRSVGTRRERSMRLVLATANPHKAIEIAEVLGPAFDLVARPAGLPEVVEDADTFEGNARLKSTALVAATGEPALADDSGLEVDALGGAPGVHSARYAGASATAADNVAKLLAGLSGVPEARRTARFRAVLVLGFPDGREVVATGAVDGSIALVPRGVSGFGYDPVFLPGDPSAAGRTFAEMTPAEKHAISHRGRALRQLVERLGSPTP